MRKSKLKNEDTKFEKFDFYATPLIYIFTGDDCDTEIYISSPKQLNQDISGKYIWKEKLNGRPAYRHESKDLYLFFAGHWKVEPQSNYKSETHAGFIKTDEDDICPVNVGKKWKGYYTGIDAKIRVLSLTDSNYQLTDIGIYIILFIYFCPLPVNHAIQLRGFHFRFSRIN